jgi:hypothetical protein
VKLEGQIGIREKRASGAKRAFTLVAAVGLAISDRIFVQEDYFVRELLLFVGCKPGAARNSVSRSRPKYR